MTSTRPGAYQMVTDVGVPNSRLAECVQITKDDLVANGIVATIWWLNMARRQLTLCAPLKPLLTQLVS